MLNYFYQMDNVSLFIILGGFFSIISIISLFLIKWYFPLHLRYQDNTVIGCTSALITLIYGVIAGFATSHLINSSNFAVDALQHEANAIVDLYRNSRWLADPIKTSIQNDIKSYLADIINVEWPMMNQGKTISHEGGKTINRISSELSQYKIQNGSEAAIVSDMIVVIRNLYDAREQRKLMSDQSLSGTIWVVIILGSILTLCISYLYGVNFYLHIFTVLCSALIISSVLFLLISLDKPFLGSYTIGPEVYQSLKLLIDNEDHYMGQKQPRPAEAQMADAAA